MKKVLNVLIVICLFSGIVALDGCKKKADPPTVTTTAVTDITVTTATSGGNVTSDGGAQVTARGVCWGTATKPTITSSKTSDGTGTGSFTSDLTGLSENTLYYVRAYATNSEGTSYGSEVTFTTGEVVGATVTTTAVTSITATTAVSGGNVTDAGGGEITARGVCWATTANPTTANDKSTDGTGTGAFTSNLTSLTAGTIYHIRAYATNSSGTAYGTDLTFTTLSVVPTLTTVAATTITTTGAASGGNITSDGGASVTARGVCWSTTTGPTVAGSHSTDGTGVGAFTSTVTGLTANTTYYLRAYATNSVGTAYGNEITFTTSQVALATVTTTAASSVASTTAVSGGNVTADGGASVTARGVCYGTTANPTVAGSKTTDGTGTGAFTSNLSALLPGTMYHIRAYATNSAGTAYGDDLTFTTTAVVPTVTTTGVTGITQTTAASGGNVTASGGANVTARGVCWATTQNPTVAGSHSSDGTGTGAFTSSITGLTAGTLYYLRAYAVNSVGTAYGNEVSFSASAVTLATLTTTAASAITGTTATSGGDITSAGGGTITARGVCWSDVANPTLSGSFTTNGTGAGTFTSSLTGLNAGVLYHIRAYATNSAGTAYGNDLTFFTTPETGSVTDHDGNIYATIQLGGVWWMAENLKVTTFNDGTAIPNVTGDAAWAALATPAYAWYNNNSANKDVYGGLYNWLAVGHGDLCPTGWHVPTDSEWGDLELLLGVPSAQLTQWGFRGTVEGAMLKSTTGWSSNGNGNNESHFNGVPAGYRYYLDGTFNNAGSVTYWWTATPDDVKAWYRRLDGSSTQIYRATVEQQAGKSVRCVMD